MASEFLTFLQQHGIKRDQRGPFEENLDLPGSRPTPEPVARGQAVPNERAAVTEPSDLAAAPVESPTPSPTRAVARAAPVAVAPAPRREPPTPDPFQMAEGYQAALSEASQHPAVLKSMAPRLEAMRQKAAGIHAANYQGDPLADPEGYAKHMGELDGRFGQQMSAKEAAYWQKWQAGDKAARIDRAEEALQKCDLATLKDNIYDLLGEGVTAIGVEPGTATIGGVEVPSHIILTKGPDGKTVPINAVEFLAQRASLETRLKLAQSQQQTAEAKRQEPTKRLQEENVKLDAEQKNKLLKQAAEAAPVSAADRARYEALQKHDETVRKMYEKAAGDAAKMTVIQAYDQRERQRLGQGGAGTPGAELWGDNPDAATDQPLPGNHGPVMPATVAEARATSRQQAEQERLRSLSPLEQERELAATAQARTRTQEETARRQAGFDQELQEIGIQAPAIKSIPELRDKALARLNEIAQQDPMRAATARAIIKAILAPSQPMRPLPWQTPADTVRAMPVTP